jgi:hypothetical protein
MGFGVSLLLPCQIRWADRSTAAGADANFPGDEEINSSTFFSLAISMLPGEVDPLCILAK